MGNVKQFHDLDDNDHDDSEELISSETQNSQEEAGVDSD